jgi:hypothetical protein
MSRTGSGCPGSTRPRDLTAAVLVEVELVPATREDI